MPCSEKYRFAESIMINSLSCCLWNFALALSDFNALYPLADFCLLGCGSPVDTSAAGRSTDRGDSRDNPKPSKNVKRRTEWQREKERFN